VESVVARLKRGCERWRTERLDGRRRNGSIELR